MIAPLLSLVIALTLIGAALYLIEQFVPMAQPFRIAIRVVVVLGFLLWLLRFAQGGSL
jgi:membrane-bound ClpP family serine protease